MAVLAINSRSHPALISVKQINDVAPFVSYSGDVGVKRQSVNAFADKRTAGIVQVLKIQNVVVVLLNVLGYYLNLVHLLFLIICN